MVIRTTASHWFPVRGYERHLRGQRQDGERTACQVPDEPRETRDEAAMTKDGNDAHEIRQTHEMKTILPSSRVPRRSFRAKAGSQSVTDCNRLKMVVEDGKKG